jgi:hypothetical protein
VPVDSFFLVKTFVTLIVVIDPVAAVPLFLTDRSSRASARAAWQAVVVAALIMGVFALFGQQILLYLGIRLPSLEAAGGCCWWLPLTCCGVRSRAVREGKVNVAFVPLGTPLLAGRERSRPPADSLHIVTDPSLRPTSSAGHLRERTRARPRERCRARSAIDRSAPAARP